MCHSQLLVVGEALCLTSHQALGCAQCKQLSGLSELLINEHREKAQQDISSAPQPGDPIDPGAQSHFVNYTFTRQAPKALSNSPWHLSGRRLGNSSLWGHKHHFNSIQPHLASWKCCHLYWHGVHWRWMQKMKVLHFKTNPGMMRPVCLTQIKCPQAAKV